MNCLWISIAPVFYPLIEFNFLHVVQIWYCSPDITHTVRALADTQCYFVQVVSLVQIPLHLSGQGSSCNRSSLEYEKGLNWLHLCLPQINTVISFSLYLSYPTRLPLLPSHRTGILIMLAKSFTLATHSAHSPALIESFFGIIATALRTAKCLFELERLLLVGSP